MLVIGESMKIRFSYSGGSLMLLGSSGILKVQVRMILRLEKPLVLFLGLRYLLIFEG
jgi:hypothetical protein